MSEEHVPLPLPSVIRSTMVKKCNVIAQFPVRNVYPNLHGTYENIMLPPDTIAKILMTHGSQVEEVLYDGKVVPLTMENYDVVHNPDDPKVIEKAQAYAELTKKNIYGDVRDITMHKLKNHTAPLPRNHYLYSIRDNYEGLPLAPRQESEERNIELQKRILETDEFQGTPLKDPTLPILNTETGEVTPPEIDPNSDEAMQIPIELEEEALLGLDERAFQTAGDEENQEFAFQRSKRNSDRNKYKGKYLLR